MSWKKILNEDHIGDIIPGYNQSQKFGMQPSEFEGGDGSTFQYTGQEYALAKIITGAATFSIPAAYDSGTIVYMTGNSNDWEPAEDSSDHAKKPLAIYLENDPDQDHVSLLTEGYIALPDSAVYDSHEESMAKGKTIYLSNDPGKITHVPTVAANRIIRQIGYCMSYTTGVGGIFYFRPDSVWVQIRP